jgi:integrase
MAKRRGHGEGSIYQRKDGRWAASISLENRRRKYFYGETRREVQEKLKIALREQQQGMLATGPQQTLKAYLEQWVEQVYRPTVKPLTYQQCRSAVYHHLIPALGSTPLQKLTAAQVQRLCTQKLDAGLAPRTVAVIHAMLQRALENAVKWGLVSRNVAKLVTLPRVERYNAQTLTSEQAMKLLEVARSSRIETLLLMAITTGMRQGELLALRWSDIDFDQGIVFVRRTVARITGRGHVESEPKTKSSRRRIVLPAVTLQALKEHQQRQEQARSKLGDRWHEQGLVFAGRYGRYLHTDSLAKTFHRLLAQAGLPHMRFHDLRHSAATILLAAGVHPKMVQELLGHSTISMTMDIYSHVLPPMQQEVANKMDGLFKQP